MITKFARLEFELFTKPSISDYLRNHQSLNMKNYFIIIISIIILLISGYHMERSTYFSDIKNELQNMNIPSPPLNFGKRGHIMSEMETKYVIPDGFDNYFSEKDKEYILKNIIQLDVLNLRKKKGWTTPDKVNSEKIPSSLIIDKKVIDKGLPVLSVVVDKVDLYDKNTGIFSNYKKKGREWERPCFMSYFNNGKLLFGTGAGIRVHGQKKEKGFRLYFRNIYGVDQFEPGIIFDKKSEPLKQFVVHDDTRITDYHFINPLAYDIAEKIGCITAKTKPVLVYLNGKLHNNGKISFTISEHLSKQYLYSHFGHDQFIFFRTKFKNDRPTEYKKLRKWVNNEKNKMTMDTAAQRIDVDNLSKWYLSQLFCGSVDIYQGLAFLDISKPGGKWKWINWDMDHSFREWEEEETEFNELMKEKHKYLPRSTLFRRMYYEDPKFRDYFKKLFMDSLNHKVTDQFLKERFEFYKNTIINFNLSNPKKIEKVKEFLNNRPEFMRKMMRKYFGSPKSHFCEVRIPKDMNIKIDGFEMGHDYRGWYFKGSKISIKVLDKNRKIKYWNINGEKIVPKGNEFEYIVNSDTVIEPVFNE